MFSYLIFVFLLWLAQLTELRHLYLNPQPLPPGANLPWILAFLIALAADFYFLYWSQRATKQSVPQ